MDLTPNQLGTLVTIFVNASTVLLATLVLGIVVSGRFHPVTFGVGVTLYLLCTALAVALSKFATNRSR